MEQINQEEPSMNKLDTLIESATDYVQKLHCDTTKWTQPFKCAMSSCHNAFVKYDPEHKHPFKFHNFPYNQHLRQIWISKCGIGPNVDTNFLKVCSDHFRLDDYERNFKEEFKNSHYKRKLKDDAIPLGKFSNSSITLNIDNVNQLEYNYNVMNLEETPPSFDLIKPVVDENIVLKEKIDKLKRDKIEIFHKMKLYDKKIRMKKRDVLIVKNQMEKLKSSILSVNEQRNLLSRVFSDAQINVLLGKRKVVWNNDDLAMAFSLRQMSSKDCYLYLKQTLNLPLPSLSCVQKWMASN